MIRLGAAARQGMTNLSSSECQGTTDSARFRGHGLLVHAINLRGGSQSRALWFHQRRSDVDVGLLSDFRTGTTHAGSSRSSLDPKPLIYGFAARDGDSDGTGEEAGAALRPGEAWAVAASVAENHARASAT